MKIVAGEDCNGTTYVISQYPELAAELPELLKEAGEVKRVNIKQYWEFKVAVTLHLSSPLVVVENLGSKGIGFNPYTDFATCEKIDYHRLTPRNGDKILTFDIDLELDSRYLGVDKHSIDFVRNSIRAFAHRIATAGFYF